MFYMLFNHKGIQNDGLVEKKFYGNVHSVFCLNEDISIVNNFNFIQGKVYSSKSRVPYIKVNGKKFELEYIFGSPDYKSVIEFVNKKDSGIYILVDTTKKNYMDARLLNKKEVNRIVEQIAVDKKEEEKTLVEVGKIIPQLELHCE